MSILHRNNVHVRGTGVRAMVFAHGFGCDQNIWRFVAPSFERHFMTVLFDHVGAGRSDLSAYSPERYASLHGYAQDVVELGVELNFDKAIFVGHSCSAMIGALASIQAPGMFESLAFVAPSPRYISDGDYVSAFTTAQLDELLRAIDDDYIGWSTHMAPVIMGNAERPELGRELAQSFCRTDPEIAKQFARTIFTSDTRAELPKVTTRSLVLQCSDDVIAPSAVGEYTHRRLPDSRLVRMRARGHCPHMSAPGDTVAALGDFLLPSANSSIRRFKARAGPPEETAAPLAQDYPESPDTESIDAATVDSSDNPADEANRVRRRSAKRTRAREALRDSLFYRVGELRMHLGRYDMYAVSLATLLADNSVSDIRDVELTITTRGATILRRMDKQGIDRDTREQFRAIDEALQLVLGRHEIASRNGAVIAAVAIVSLDRQPTGAVKNRDWFDHETASNEEISQFIDAMEQDILKVVSLYVRVANCALTIKSGKGTRRPH